MPKEEEGGTRIGNARQRISKSNHLKKIDVRQTLAEKNISRLRSIVDKKGMKKATLDKPGPKQNDWTTRGDP